MGPYRTSEGQNWKASNPKEVAVQLVYHSHQIHTSLVNLMFTADSVSFVENRQALGGCVCFSDNLSYRVCEI